MGQLTFGFDMTSALTYRCEAVRVLNRFMQAVCGNASERQTTAIKRVNKWDGNGRGLQIKFTFLLYSGVHYKLCRCLWQRQPLASRSQPLRPPLLRRPLSNMIIIVCARHFQVLRCRFCLFTL